MAVSLQQQQGGAPGPLSDLELARQLQQEEYQQQQQLQQQQQQQQQQQPQASAQAAQQVITAPAQVSLRHSYVLSSW